MKFATDDELEVAVLGRHMRLDYTSHGTFISNCYRAVTQFRSLLDKFFRVRCTPEKRVIGNTM